MNAFEGRSEAAQTVAGLLSAASLTLSAIGIAYRPVRLIPIAVVLALVAVTMGGRHRGLATFAVGASIVAWMVGMTIALLADTPLF